MKPSLTILCIIIAYATGCSNVRTKPMILSKSVSEMPQPLIMVDPRDGEMYDLVTIGREVWMAQNLRYNIPGSKINPESPSAEYGRLYDGITAQNICPEGWHLPSDEEWSNMEIALGLDPSEAVKTGWRGEHGIKLKSNLGWIDSLNGTNSSGFNGLPAGYFFVNPEGKENDLGGLGMSAGYWAAMEDEDVWLRFLGGPLASVNRFSDSGYNWKLACRCVKN